MGCLCCRVCALPEKAMKNLRAAAALFGFGILAAHGQLVLSDDYNVATTGSGFTLDSGVNLGINPPTTRLTGSAAANLRYLYTQTGTPKATTAYTITGNKISVARAANSGRFSMSQDGTTPFDFSSALGTLDATPVNPFIYDVRISLANTYAGGAATTRYSFGLGTVESDVTTWDFGFQLWRAVATDTTYTFQKRIDLASSGLGADQNLSITGIPSVTFGNEINLLMRVTDAGAESGANYNSKVQLSLDNGSTWFYDTSADSSLVNGWRLDAASRYFIWDQAGAGSGTGSVTYDNFSITLIQTPEPSSSVLCALGGLALFLKRRQRR